MSFVSVTDITNFRPAQVIAGQEVELLADAIPNNATNRTIEWSIVSGSGTIRRQGNRSFLVANNTSQLITLRATIRNGRIQQ